MIRALPVIELTEAARTHPGPPPVPALQPISLRIHPGEILAIVGPSGSGKTTLLHLLGTLDRPSRGTVRINGHDVTALSDREISALRSEHIGFVFQNSSLIDNLSAVDNVATALLYRGVRRREREQRARDALARVGLAHRLQHRPQELSGGEQQRVAIARAMVGGPAVVLADEPTGNLDSATGQLVYAQLLELHSDGTALVIVTHDHSLAERAPRRVELRDGRITLDTGSRP
jgi:putative ABC transport system ATP-binding protein